MPRHLQTAWRPIVGRKEMAAILGVHPNNSHRNRLPDLPESLQEKFGDQVVAVSVTPLWFRDDIERYAETLQARRREREASKTA